MRRGCSAIRGQGDLRGRGRPPRGGPPGSVRVAPRAPRVALVGGAAGAAQGPGKATRNRERLRARHLGGGPGRRAVTTVLVIKEGPLAGRRIDVETELVIGREDAGLTIEDAEISRRHAAFRVR